MNDTYFNIDLPLKSNSVNAYHVKSKWVEVDFYSIADILTDFGGFFKSISLLFNLVFLPILIWQSKRQFAIVLGLEDVQEA